MRKQKDEMQVNVAGLRRNIKNIAHNYSDAQVKVREATSNDPWGPSATIMAELADLTYNVVAFSEIMQMIWKRLNDHGRNWRHVYKALILLEYMIKTGSEKVAHQCTENIYAIQTLRDFSHSEEGKDQGTHVREKAKQLVNLLKNDDYLKNERIKALKAKERFALHPSGFGSDGYIEGPTQRDMPPGWQEEPKPVSELEMVRPQTAGEEELQLQLAMAMSREEAEQEEAKRRSDDVRLKLALSQSEQDFKEQPGVRPPTKREENQSHLLDLLDISLGEPSISSAPLGTVALGSGAVGPWDAPASRADPWSGTASPQIDPWQPAAGAIRPATVVPSTSFAAPGVGNNGDAWGIARNQSPSLTSGSSPEGWTQVNGNAKSSSIATVDPWNTKTVTKAIMSAVPPESANSASLDPWLSEPASNPSLPLEDPWAPKVDALNDPWKKMDENTLKKPSPDLDDFDIITNRLKTGESTASNNNATPSLLDDLDPLSTKFNSLTTKPSTGAVAKKPLKDPQAFLGENSALVNLDNLIKPIVPQVQAGAAAYNPFSDTLIAPKTNLFQQQQPIVPSINQLKQQAPFPVTMNQDPWAPLNNANISNQKLNEVTPIVRRRPVSLNFVHTSAANNISPQNSLHNSSMAAPPPEEKPCRPLQNSISDFYLFEAETSAINSNDVALRQFAFESIKPRSFEHKPGSGSGSYYNSSFIGDDAFSENCVPASTPSNNNNNNSFAAIHPTTTRTVTSTPNYSSVLYASLTKVPGVIVSPIGESNPDDDFFGFGGYNRLPSDSCRITGPRSDNLAFSSNLSTHHSTKLEMNNNNHINNIVNNNNNNNNNNSSPWLKPEVAATNPFLS